jgi:hypothetical protein
LVKGTEETTLPLDFAIALCNATVINETINILTFSMFQYPMPKNTVPKQSSVTVTVNILKNNLNLSAIKHNHLINVNTTVTFTGNMFLLL